MLLSPLVGFFLSILCFREKAARILFVLFSFYFGWFYEPQLDLLNHYNHFISLLGQSPFDIWNDSGPYARKEPFPVLFKYILGKISTDPHVFSAFACSIYAYLFVYGVMGSIRDLYVQKMSLPAWTIFLLTVFTVEYYWFLGLRYWCGAFVFAAFYIRYDRHKEKKFLFLSFLSILFHFTHIILCAAAILNIILKDKFKIHYIIVIIGCLVRCLKIPLVTIVSKLNFLRNYIPASARNDDIIQSVAERANTFRTEGNIFYMIRSDILLIGGVIILFILWKHFKTQLFDENKSLWGLILILFAFANLGYTDMTFYTRLYKLTILLLYIFLYVKTMSFRSSLSTTSQYTIFGILLVPLLYAIATTVVSHREYLLQADLWFSNFFIK